MVDDSRNVAGVDVGKRRLDVALWPGGETWAVANDPAGHQALALRLATLGVQRVGLEASGGYERAVADALGRAGLAVVLFQPAQVRHFARWQLRRAKNDRLDAQLIARCTADTTQPARVPDPALDALAEQLTYDEQLAGDLMQLKTRRDRYRQPTVRAALEARIRQLAGERRACLTTLRRLARAVAAVRRRIELLATIPGIGFLNALSLAVRVPELGRMTRQQAAALLGVAPFDDDSGRRHGARRIAGGRKRPRRLLFMAALTASRCDAGLRAVYQGLLKRGKAHKQALVAVMRKLVALANAVLKHDRPWVPRDAAQPA